MAQLEKGRTGKTNGSLWGLWGRLQPLCFSTPHVEEQEVEG